MFVKFLKQYQTSSPGSIADVPDENAAKALIDQGIAEEVKGDPLAPLIQKSMEGLFGSMNKAIETSVEGALKEFAKAQTKSRKNQVPAIFGEGQDGDPKKTFGAFLLAIKARDHKTLEAMGSRFVEWESDKKTALVGQTGTLGGYLVPEDFYGRLMTLVTESSIVRPRATIIPQRARTTQIPSLDVVTAPSAGNSAFLGGVIARWTEEAASITETEPSFKNLDLTNYELSGYSKISNTLLADEAIGLESFLMTLFSRAVAWYEDYAFLRGDGVAKPLGVQSWTGFVSVTRSGASAFALADVAGMYARLLPGGRESSICWVVHPTVLVKLIQMTGGDNVIFIGNDVRPGLTMNILGKPVYVSEKVPALNTAGDVTLNDFSQYLIGDRQQIEIAYSEHVAFLTNQSVWRFVSRVGGMPWIRDKITLADASNTLTPFVGLAAG